MTERIPPFRGIIGNYEVYNHEVRPGDKPVQLVRGNCLYYHNRRGYYNEPQAGGPIRTSVVVRRQKLFGIELIQTLNSLYICVDPSP